MTIYFGAATSCRKPSFLSRKCSVIDNHLNHGKRVANSASNSALRFTELFESVLHVFRELLLDACHE